MTRLKTNTQHLVFLNCDKDDNPILAPKQNLKFYVVSIKMSLSILCFILFLFQYLPYY